MVKTKVKKKYDARVECFNCGQCRTVQVPLGILVKDWCVGVGVPESERPDCWRCECLTLIPIEPRLEGE